MKKKVVLEVKNLSKSYKKKLVLDDLSLKIVAGEIFGLIGANGVGKTTLIKIILDLLKPNLGSVEIFDLSSLDKNSRANIAYLPEKFQPSFLLKGHEFLKLSMGYLGKEYNREKALELAAILDLEQNALDNRVTKYSKGMGQKLGLIATFLSEAKLLILDEPMSGLDPHVRIKLKDLLEDYAKKGNTIFFSSHILSDIDEICNRVGVIHKSSLCFTGTAKEFKNKYKSDTLERAFLQVINS